MPKDTSIASSSKSPDSNVVPTLDSALDTNDLNLFYTASVHFLKKRLEEKTNNTTTKSERISQSCCDLQGRDTSSSSYNGLDSDLAFNRTSLSMHQILPFPKTHQGIFSRMVAAIRKYRRQLDVTEVNSNVSKIASKLSPRCERFDKGRSSCLVAIQEESDESVKNGARRVRNVNNDATENNVCKRVNR
ncbi:unnamed protein product [Colias eurytheme]|nr:unnamed protein product [Colias eurytheme]